MAEIAFQQTWTMVTLECGECGATFGTEPTHG